MAAEALALVLISCVANKVFKVSANTYLLILIQRRVYNVMYMHFHLAKDKYR